MMSWRALRLRVRQLERSPPLRSCLSVESIRLSLAKLSITSGFARLRQTWTWLQAPSLRPHFLESFCQKLWSKFI